MRLMTPRQERVLRQLEILAYGNLHLVDQALACPVIGRQRTLSDVVNFILRHREEPTDPAIRVQWGQAAKAALAERAARRRGWFGRR